MQIIKSGILTTIQDAGRSGHRHSGINPNGAMDKTAARLLNILLGNNADEALLELHFPATEILFDADTLFAIGGADFTPLLTTPDGQTIALNNWQCAWASAGTVLKFGKRQSGQRAYVAVKGGLNAPSWLGSRSTNGLLGFNTIKAGQLLDTFPADRPQVLPYLGHSLRPPYGLSPCIRVIRGNEYTRLTERGKVIFEEHFFTVSRLADRMGYRLTGEPLLLTDTTELLSSAVDFGTIQLLPDGQMIILMADHQTTGGYPRLGHVVSVDLPLLAQSAPVDKLCFQLISQVEAEELLLLQEAEIRKLKATIDYYEAHLLF